MNHNIEPFPNPFDQYAQHMNIVVPTMAQPTPEKTTSDQLDSSFKLQNSYVIGCHVMWYEIEMLDEYVESCIQMVQDVQNHKNVKFNFCINLQEYFESIDWYKLPCQNISEFSNILQQKISRIRNVSRDINIDIDLKYSDDPFYNIADYRRDLNNRYCKLVDYVLWGETDSLWPKETLEIIDFVSAQVNQPKHIITFAYRKNWDNSWDKLTHPLFKSISYQEDEVLTAEYSEKSYMSLGRMNEINKNIYDRHLDIEIFSKPKFDGSCLVISAELIKSGINIPHSLLLAGEDTSFAYMCERVLGDEYIQYHIRDVLRVHNRRHPKKRMYIRNENNPHGFCDDRKGNWWLELSDKSKFNLENLFKQIKFKK